MAKGIAQTRCQRIGQRWAAHRECWMQKEKDKTTKISLMQKLLNILQTPINFVITYYNVAALCFYTSHYVFDARCSVFARSSGPVFAVNTCCTAYRAHWIIRLAYGSEMHLDGLCVHMMMCLVHMIRNVESTKIPIKREMVWRWSECTR